MGSIKKVAHIGKDAKGNIESWGDIFTKVDGENEEKLKEMKVILDNVHGTPGVITSSDDGYTYKV